MPSRYDKNAAWYKREMRIVFVVVTVLTLLGGWLLGQRITEAERQSELGVVAAEDPNARSRPAPMKPLPSRAAPAR